MLNKILSKVALSVVKNYGKGILSSIGKNAVKTAIGTQSLQGIGQYVYQHWLSEDMTEVQVSNNKNYFVINNKAKYGSPIPLIFGRMRIDGRIIWISPIKTKTNTSITNKYIKKNNVNLVQKNINLERSISLAFALCEGEITQISKVWWGAESIDISQYQYRLYKGDEGQLPDSLIVSHNNHTPGYRGLAYIVFEDLPLVDFRGTIPSFSFEVLKKNTLLQGNSVEEIVQAIVIIPGSGEYVYDTAIQYKETPGKGQKVINMHNQRNIGDSMDSLNQLQTTCPNVNWVAPVACWFADNLDARYCTIKPGVEYNDNYTKYNEDWIVGKYNRTNAKLITRETEEQPQYGGSVNDASLIRYLKELKSRKLKIMFYPIVLLDIKGKPWRGKITSQPQYINDFFNKDDGYNNFILHYATLVKDYVDAFIIGSELIGLTKVRDGNNFPAVDELISLSRKVKNIMGKDVLITYAADWSEYHHTDGGWFNLDPLWAEESIDFIGIDCYFPVTNTTSSTITAQDIMKGYSSGEGYDYYIDYVDNSQYPLQPEYAWKNIKYWWENAHTDPDGQQTLWIPKSKNIWFTEFGFPSIDKATNQPNVFYDPECIDGGTPKYSKGTTDFSIQRKAIKAFIEYWKEQEYIEQCFLWTWDARPYPAWPHSDYWRDRNLWEKGHWVNNKFGISNLASILLQISQKASIDIDNLDVRSIDVPIEGVVFSSHITMCNAISTLRTAHFFDICFNSNGKISFVKRGSNQNKKHLTSEQFLKLSPNSYIETIDIPQELRLNSIDLYFLNPYDDFKSHHVLAHNETNNCVKGSSIYLPFILTQEEADNIAHLILNNASTESKIIKFKLDHSYLNLRPSDYILLQHKHQEYKIRIIKIKVLHTEAYITAIIDDINTYSRIPHAKQNININSSDLIQSELRILDLPLQIDGANNPYIAVLLRHTSNAILYTKFSNESEKQWNNITTLKTTDAIGKIVTFDEYQDANIFIMDYISIVIISGYNLEKYISNKPLYAVIGNEVITFQKLEKIENNTYRISHLTRGEFDTEHFINTHQPNEDFTIIIDSEINILQVSRALEYKTLEFKSCNITKLLKYQNTSEKPLKPYIVRNEILENYLYISWVTRLKNNTDWDQRDDNHALSFTVIITCTNQIIKKQTEKNTLKLNLSDHSISGHYIVDILVVNHSNQRGL